MPELPEVETICRGLTMSLQGAKILKVEARRSGLRFEFPNDLKSKLEGRIFVQMRRRSKYILIDLDDGNSLILHLGMSGRLLIAKPNDPVAKHDHVLIECEKEKSLRFNDPRRFGVLDIYPTEHLMNHRLLKNLGVEALSSDLTLQYLKAMFTSKKTTIKVALLDQRIIAGLGNIYVCEALFWAGISPERSAQTLIEKEIEALIVAIVNVLNAALKAGGSSLRDYVQSDGEQGGFQHQFAVYNREGQHCPRCKESTSLTPCIKRITQAGRSTFYCSYKQV
ncbi:MAG: bifunctional DNA-formamidopyrimidine glycosylase/DNA-(apurinic or apyrimidinic site) lyase [Pseudomonadota bacterium]